MKVALYIDIDDTIKRINVFKDETISVTSSIQNVNDISKVYTDYSQTFTIPADNVNNAIFKHWYENSVDNAYDQRLRYNGWIEVDTAIFRYGRWQLESATIEKNIIQNYKLTFFGNLKSLTDRFGEDKLINVQELNDYTFDYTASNVVDIVKNNVNSDISFPLISSNRVWQNTGGGADDITISAHGINTSELFPAVRVKKIFEAFENKYGVTFNGTFLNEPRFTEAFLWFKNKETFVNKSSIVDVDLTSKVDGGTPFSINLTTNKITYVGLPNILTLSASFGVAVSIASGVGWSVFVYRNNILVSTITGVGSEGKNIFTQNGINENILYLGVYSFKFHSDIPIAFACNFAMVMASVTPPITTNINYNTSTANSGTLNTTGDLDLPSLAPDIKVSDFFSGILKMFNLTAFSTDGTNFILEQLEEWYQKGKIKDFTKYTTTDITFERLKAYKKINFKYQKSESLINRQFFNLFAREYGDLSYEFTNDGSDYSIELPFENIQFNKFTGTYLQVGYCLKTAPDYKNYIPKPVILYRYGNQPADFYLEYSSTHVHATSYNVFGQDIVQEGLVNTLNWGLEISTLYLNVITNTLFNNYYLNYLTNLYSLKSRMAKVKMRLPLIELIDLKLNDRVVIRDKKYIINNFTTNLLNFEVDLELIQDFRPAQANNNFGRQIAPDNVVNEIRYIDSNDVKWSIDTDSAGFIDSLSCSNGVIYITPTDNTGGTDRVIMINSDKGDKILLLQTT